MIFSCSSTGLVGSFNRAPRETLISPMTFSHIPQTLSTILRCCSLCLGFLTLTPGKSWAGRVSRRYLPFLYSRKAVSNRF